MNNNYVKRFIMEVSRNAEDSTCNSYENDVKYFLCDMAQYKNIHIDNELELIQSITNNDVEDWIQYRTKLADDSKHYALSTMNRKIVSLNLFFKYIKDNKNLIEQNPFANVSLYDLSKRTVLDTNVLILDDIKKMIDETYIKQVGERCFEFNSARTRFVIALMCTTGLRISEVLSIELDNIEQIDGAYMVNISKDKVKNDINKRVPICGKVVMYYHEYIKERSKLKNIIDSNVLIISSRGKIIDRSTTERDIKKYIDRVGIQKSINNHSCRHIFRTSLTKNNVNESLICIIGGWSRHSLAMSAIYTHDTIDLDSEKIKVCNIL